MMARRRPSTAVLARVVGAALAVALTALVVRRLAGDWTDLSALLDGLAARPRVDAVWLGVAWGLQTVGWLVLVAAWRGMLGEAGRSLPPARHLRASAVSALAQVVPGSLWAPASRVALYRREGVAAFHVGAAIVQEWLLLGLAGLVLYALAAPWSHATTPDAAAVAMAVGLLALAALHPAASGRALAAAARRTGSPVPPTPPVTALARRLAAEVVVLGLSGGALYALMRAVAPTWGLADALAALALTTAMANFLTFVPGTGIVREAAFVLLLTPLLGSSLVALGVALAWRAWSLAVQVSWAALALAVAALPSSGRPATKGPSPAPGAPPPPGA